MKLGFGCIAGLFLLSAGCSLPPALGQAGSVATSPAASAPAQPPQSAPAQTYAPMPSLDLASMDPSADPCQDFYKFACGKFAANHPIPPDQPLTNGGYMLYNVTTQELNRLLVAAESGASTRTPDQARIGDYYHACMNTAAIERAGLEPIQPLLKQIDGMSLLGLASLTGQLQRMGVNVLFSYGEQQDFKDATRQIAFVDQGGLGLPEKDYYLRTGAKDEELRRTYVAHVARMLSLAGEPDAQAQKDAAAILAFETGLARASLDVTSRRDPDKIYHLVPVSEVARQFPLNMFAQFEDAIHSPRVTELNDAVPGYIPALIQLVRSTDIGVLRAYFRYHLLTAVAPHLPQRFDEENFSFYGRTLEGVEQQQPQWKRCTNSVDASLGEALGKSYVEAYFPPASKARVLEMVTELEHAMDAEIGTLEWMSPATKTRAREKLHLVANKIGYPDHWRDYTALAVKPDDPVGNALRANIFENDRQLDKIGKPVDRGEWSMSPPTVDAYYDPSMNDINFPAGILQPNFYDPKAGDAVNYGHIGAIIGHELTHGFDDEGRKFDGHGNLTDWWTPADAKGFDTRTSCLVDEYNKFIAVDDVHVNGKLTLGENTADNGGLLLAYKALLDHARKAGDDLQAKSDGYTGLQRFYIAYAQNWCANQRPEALRLGAQTDPHSPDQFRADGPIVNQPAFGAAFSCRTGAPMVPANSCRVW